MMKIRKRMLRKCWASTHHGRPGWLPGETIVPG
jgi:hypothetical protein